MDEIQTKVFRVFLLVIHSHLYSFASDFYFFKLTQPVTVSVKEKGGKFLYKTTSPSLWFKKGTFFTPESADKKDIHTKNRGLNRVLEGAEQLFPELATCTLVNRPFLPTPCFDHRVDVKLPVFRDETREAEVSVPGFSRIRA